MPANHDHELEQWAREMEAGAARIPAEDHERFLRAIEEVERQSKEAVAREWGIESRRDGQVDREST